MRHGSTFCFSTDTKWDQIENLAQFKVWVNWTMQSFLPCIFMHRVLFTQLRISPRKKSEDDGNPRMVCVSTTHSPVVVVVCSILLVVVGEHIVPEKEASDKFRSSREEAGGTTGYKTTPCHANPWNSTKPSNVTY